MDAGEAAGSSRSFPSFVWIIEHVWRHNMLDILRVVGASCWPDVDLQSLSLEESWTLRVASAHVFSVVRRRDVALFEGALGFLGATYQLLPGLVAAIKHMKIMFGLKTLVVMAMLRDGRGTVDIVSKINQFFPNKLPEYQNRCSQREMFLMRKNHVDFKGLAQALALDKDRLQEYIQEEMEEQYGERYAQKVEDRLLQYLRELEAALPGDTHIDKILKKQSPVTEEEKLLLDVRTSDCGAMAATLRKLLLCDVTSCRPDGVSQLAEGNDVRISGQRAVRGLGHSDEGGAPVLKRKKKTKNLRQFCSKHQRWVRSILQECPDDCSTVSWSPPLFPSSSSSSSSQDLTPSNLVPRPSHRPPAGQACEAGRSRSDHLPSSLVQLGAGASSSTSEPGPTCLDYKPSASGSSSTPAGQTSGNQDSKSVLDKTCRDERVPISDPPTSPSGSGLSRRFRRTISRSTSKPSSGEFLKDPRRPPVPVHLNFSGPAGRHLLNSTSQSEEPEKPEDRLNSGSAGQTEPHPESSSSRGAVSPALLDQVASSSSSTSKSSQTSPDCDVCRHHQVTPGPSSPPSHQSSGFEDRLDIKRLLDSQESLTSNKLSPKFRQTWSSRSAALTESSPQPSTSRDHLLPAAPSPVVHLVDISSSAASTNYGTSPDCRIDGQQQEPSGQTSGNNNSASVQPESCLNLKTPPECQDELDSSSRLLRTRRASALSPESRETCATVKQSGASWRRPSNQKAPKYTSCPPSPRDRSVSGSETPNQDNVTSGSTAQTGRPPRPSALTPVVRLVDIFSNLNFKPCQASPCEFVQYSNNRRSSGSGVPPRRTPRERDASSVRLKTCSDMKTPTEPQDRPQIPHRVSKLSRNSTKFQLTEKFNVSVLPTSEASPPRSFCCSSDIRGGAHTRGLLLTDAPPQPPRLSLQSQASLLQSSLLQPYVSLTRLEAEERRPPGETEEERVDSSFDLNELYSDSSGSDDDEDPDPDYKPSLKKKRLLLEYENAKMAN